MPVVDSPESVILIPKATEFSVKLELGVGGLFCGGCGDSRWSRDVQDFGRVRVNVLQLRNVGLSKLFLYASDKGAHEE